MKTLEENEKRRQEAEARARADVAEIKVAVESRLPQMEKCITDINSALGALNRKVEQLEDSVAKGAGLEKLGRDLKVETSEQLGDQTPKFLHGMRDPLLNSASPFGFDSTTGEEGGNMNLSCSLPPMSCPQFNGDNPQMWRANCEVYFDVYGIPANTWVKVATLNFVGNTAFWLQSVRNQLIGITWHDLCERICARFTRDQQQTLRLQGAEQLKQSIRMQIADGVN